MATLEATWPNGASPDQHRTETTAAHKEDFIEVSLGKLVRSVVAEEDDNPVHVNDDSFFVADMGEVYRQHDRWKSYGATDPRLFVKALQDSLTVFEHARNLGYSLELLDVGGGFSSDSFNVMSQTLRKALDEHFPDKIRIIAEPGRYFVATAFAVACNVIARREVLSEDGPPHSMLTLNDGVYGSFMDCLLSHWQRQPFILRCSD
ncbi:MAG: hypothetical protein Q9221_008123 [Calogaya cf. arnoldii]